MSYTLETKPTSNQSSRANFGASSKPTGITVHWWGDPDAGASHNGVVSWLRGPAGGTANRNSSAHYVVSGRRVTKLAEETRATWHSGNRIGNGTTIGIEMHPRMSAQDWETLVELCVDIENRHGSMKYYRHLDWKATACPGVYADQIAKLVRDINAAHGGKKPAAPKKKSSTTSSASRSDHVRAEDSIRRICIRATEGTESNSTGHLIGLYQLAQIEPFGLYHEQHWGNVTDQHYRWVHRLQVEMNKWKGSKVNENGNYNPATHGRVKELQERNHGGTYPSWAAVDGIAGPVFCDMLGVKNYPN